METYTLNRAASYRCLFVLVCSSKLFLQGTNYRKTNAAMEMRRINRESFWARAEVNPWPPSYSHCNTHTTYILQHASVCLLYTRKGSEGFFIGIYQTFSLLFPVSLVQREEEERKEEERRRTAEQRRRLEKERILKERRDAEERDRKMDEKLRMIEEQRSGSFPHSSHPNHSKKCPLYMGWQ